MKPKDVRLAAAACYMVAVFFATVYVEWFKFVLVFLATLPFLAYAVIHYQEEEMTANKACKNCAEGHHRSCIDPERCGCAQQGHATW